ncbi:hypothetical protein [Streptomyces sp. NBC_00582]|uniref:hypothetical protein n=1 Tax=Streptomyces sp. NBC_00582 TaxID=2975783 RepID=UPI002E8092D9|nr:hypothetical protein [Streptomyces sp. NBC_00582]WUB64625.1 hypothetical protein OG852_31600 [Streptomyces sp. NBC_00582]
MRVRLTDGTNEVEITVDDGGKGKGRRRLDDVENTALRILDALRDHRPAQRGTTFGFTPDVVLDSSAERAEPYDDGRDQYDEDDDA